MKLTEWYEPDQKPVRAGTYETRFKCGKGWQKGYSRWVGGHWTNQFETPEEASREFRRGFQRKEWRGLAKEPKK